MAGATGKGVGVAVIDTGIDGGAAGLRGRATGTSRVVASVVDEPGRHDAQADTYGHGTHVAGIIAGDSTPPRRRRSAGRQLHRRRPGREPDRDQGVRRRRAAGPILDAIYGLQFAVDHKDEYNIRVVNLSLASTVAESYRTDPLDAAVESAYFHGILVVAAAGNRGAAADADVLLARQRPVRAHGRRSRRPGHARP